MDRNSIIGFVLIGLILIGYSFYNFEQAKKAENNSQKKVAVIPAKPNNVEDNLSQSNDTSNKTPILNANSDSVKQINLQQSYGVFASAVEGSEVLKTVENQNLKITFTNKGGNIKSIEVKEFKTYDKKPLILFDDNQNQLNYQFFINNNRDVNTKDLYFSTVAVVKDNKGNQTVSYRINAGPNQYIEQQYIVPQNGHMLSYNLNVVGMENIIPKNSTYINLDWKRSIRKVEQSKDFENRYTQLFYRYTSEEDDLLSETENASASLATPVQWISCKQQFFNSTIINKEGFYSGNVKSTINDKANLVKYFESSMVLSYSHQKAQQYKMQLYFGPNHYQTLKSYNLGLESIIPLGTGIMSWVSPFNKYFIIPIFNFLEGFISSYGIIILILTLIIKTILFPLTYKSYKSAALMKALKPELDALKEKYGDDQQKFGTEQWKLYSQAGVNPLGGCLPMVLQMPILIAMYYFFPASIELRQEHFLWAHDLSTYDTIYNLPFNIPFYGDHISLFTLLMTVTSILYAVTNNQMMGNTMQPGMELMKYMPYVFPVMLMGVFNSFPAALTYYYFLQNIISYGQQWIIKKFFIDEDKLHQHIQDNKKKPVKKSMFQQKLEDIANQQKQAQAQKKKK